VSAMRFWPARAADRDRTDWMMRFDPRFWTVNFPRPAMASVVTTGPTSLRADAVFHHADALAGLIWASEDSRDHPLLGYETSRDYRGLTLSFRWRAQGLKPLDAVFGPVLTIEGRDSAGNPRAWYVRLWNYATGTPEDAQVVLRFDALDGGFLLPAEADPVWAGDVDRMFFSLVAPAYDGTPTRLAAPAEATLWLEDLRCEGGGAMLRLGDAFLPEHELRIATAYDDSYDLTPERLLRTALHLGYRGIINHYVGMSHYARLAWDPGEGALRAQPGPEPLNAPCHAWHADFLARARALGYQPILSLSYELFDADCPQAWKQRAHDGSPAATGYTPPSTLLSPASTPAMAYLADVTRQLARLQLAAGLRVRFQVGEPWWWVPDHSGKACIHDAATEALYTLETGQPVPPRITDLRGTLSPAQQAYVAWCGSLLGRSTLMLRDAARSEAADAVVHLLFYAPQVLERAPAFELLNLPAEWAWPAFDVLQLEDYDFVIRDDPGAQLRAAARVAQRLAYPASAQHYMSGFATQPGDMQQWRAILDADARGAGRGVAERILWALPQVMRDGFTCFRTGGPMQPFHDVAFPLALGREAQLAPEFQTQVVTSLSGHETRNSQWASARLRFDAGVGVRSEADVRTLIDFFRARRGQAAAFRLRDPLDHSSAAAGGAPAATDQPLGTGDGTRTRFALVKAYGADAPPRRITRPVPGSVRVAVAGVELTSGWTLAPLGEIWLDAPPASGQAVTAGFLFDVPVRFATDALEISLSAVAAGEVPAVPLVEVREG
jgi:uncharacterized protein (TIGR02217 family)